MTLPSHRAWLIDLDGTLYRHLPVKLAMAAELLLFGWSALHTIKRFRHEHEALHHELGNNPHLSFSPSPWAEQVRRTARALRLPEPHVVQIIERWMIERPAFWLQLFRRRSLLTEIERRRQGGIHTALVSDYPAQSKLGALRARHLFDCIVANGEHPKLTRLKPSPEGYLLAASELGVRPAECLVVGDRPDLDGVAAQRAGMDFQLIR